MEAGDLDRDARQGLLEPVPFETERLLRRIVRDHVASEPRRRHVPLLHVGRRSAHGIEAETIHAIRGEDRTDHALRADIVAAMVRRVRAQAPAAPLVWLTRGGAPEVQDVDADWLAGATQAFGEAGLPLVFVIVGRHGWLDPRSGVRRAWVRLRH
jgi:hypothetical protein